MPTVLIGGPAEVVGSPMYIFSPVVPLRHLQHSISCPVFYKYLIWSSVFYQACHDQGKVGWEGAHALVDELNARGVPKPRNPEEKLKFEQLRYYIKCFRLCCIQSEHTPCFDTWRITGCVGIRVVNKPDKCKVKSEKGANHQSMANSSIPDLPDIIHPAADK